MRYKICIVADVPNWAFDSIAQEIKKKLSKKYYIKIEYFERRKDVENFYEFIESIKSFDLIHFLNRRTLLAFNTETFKKKVMANNGEINTYIEDVCKKITTSVYDYLQLDENGINENISIYNKYSKAYYTSTKKLYEIYSAIPIIKKPEMFIHDICDNDIFTPRKLERFSYNNIANRKIIVGWVGNSRHTGENTVDLKGFRTILKPVINELIEENYNIEGYYADRNERWRTADEMPEYYEKIDICICASIHEGTPRPVLEAMYSGIPIIATDVGIVSEAFGEKQKEFIIGDRENGKNDENIKKNLKQKILQLYNNREIFKELSQENLISIEKFDGGKTIKKFEDFFDLCLKKN